jgi:hypothetical protein
MQFRLPYFRIENNIPGLYGQEKSNFTGSEIVSGSQKQSGAIFCTLLFELCTPGFMKFLDK